MQSILEHIPAQLTKLAAIEADVAARQPTIFWQQCVRDTTGKWDKYDIEISKHGSRYFMGAQPMVDYASGKEPPYLLANIQTRKSFYEGLPAVATMCSVQFCQWLDTLRRTLDYRPTTCWLHVAFMPTTRHTKVVRQDVMAIAVRYHDPYNPFAAINGPYFPGFPAAAQPYDTVAEGLIYHHYPSMDYADIYLQRALDILKQVLSADIANRTKYCETVADFYQALTNLQYFKAINASLYMNLANGLLELAGLQGIEHGIIDFVALRLQPENFRHYFYDEIMSHQTNII
jgi:hypothetical protein